MNRRTFIKLILASATNPLMYRVFQSMPINRATGGVLKSAKMYIVGDDSPETFCPNAHGSVIDRKHVACYWFKQ